MRTPGTLSPDWSIGLAEPRFLELRRGGGLASLFQDLVADGA